jgi:hybrid cluster-associated redox disulfide protein
MDPSREMRIGDLLDLHPSVAGVLASFGLPCQECIVAPRETLEEGARLNGLDPEEILARLRELPASARPARPPSPPDSPR